MRSLLILAALVGVTLARPRYFGLGLGARSLYHSPLAYSSVVSPPVYHTVAAAPAPITYAAPVEISSQYHAQDELGQYTYGYAGGPSAKSEIKTWDGVTRGGYSYVDAEGKIQTVNYVADPVNGFRVAATNLPVAPEAIPAESLVAPTPVQDTPEVAAAKEAHFAAFAEAKAAAEAAPDDPEPAEEQPAAEEPAADPAPMADAAPAAEVAPAADAAPAAEVAPASTDLLPASVLSGEVTAIPYPSLSYAAYHYSPAVAPAQIAYPSSVAPYNHYAYSTYAPFWHPSPAFHAPYAAPFAPIKYSAPAPITYTAPAPVTYTAPAPVTYTATAPITYSVPAVAQAPVHYAAPVEVSSQYHAQDELGQYSYGYAGGPSAKSEVRTWDGVTRGGYSYIDAEGKVQTVNYVADPVNGFRVAATNLPVAPEVPAAPALETLSDTAEVAAAKAEHLAAVEEAKARLTAA